MTRFALKAFSFEEFECRFHVMIAIHNAVTNANRGSQTIVDRIKWKSKPPFAPNQGWSRAKAKTRHFPILDLGGRGYEFCTCFVQDCSSFKYLGVTLSEDLSWADHVKNIMSKTNQRLGLIRRIKHLLPLHARLTLYRSLILPRFDYGDIISGDKNNATLMNDLQIQQNKAAKILLDKAKYSSATDALEILKWKRLDQRRHMHRCVFIFRCLNDMIDFDVNFRQNSAFHNYKTRQCNKLRLPAPKTNWGRQKLTYQASNDFNNLNLETQGTKSVLLFKKKVQLLS